MADYRSLRRTLFAGALVALSLLGDSFLYAVLPLRYAEAGISLMAVGWLLSVNRYVRLLTNPLAGMVGARLGWAAAVAVSLWLTVVATAGYGLLKGVWLLTLVRALWGLNWSSLKLGGMAAVLAESPTGRRSRLMGIFTGVFRLGSLVGVVVGGYLADRMGYAPTTLVLAAATLVGAVLATLPSALSGRWGAPARGSDMAVKVSSERLYHRWLPAGVVEWAACLSGSGLHLVISGIVTATVGLLVKERLGAQVAAGSWMLGAATVSGLILGVRFFLDLAVGPVIGHYADRRGRGRTLAVTAIVLAVALVALGRTSTLVTMALAATLLFSASTGAAAILDGWAGDIAGANPGRFLPVYNTWIDLGAATGPVLGIWVAVHIGLASTYAFAAGIVLLTWAVQTYLTRSAAAGA